MVSFAYDLLQYHQEEEEEEKGTHRTSAIGKLDLNDSKVQSSHGAFAANGCTRLKKLNGR